MNESLQSVHCTSNDQDPTMERIEPTDDAMPPWALGQGPPIHITERIANDNDTLADLCTSTTESRRRRGRPRSSIFAYYTRMEDEDGMFLGNQCRFCSFISRDKSENPTYLSRHIRKACRAPDHVKESVGMRKPPTGLFLPGGTPFSTGNDGVGNYRTTQAVNPTFRTCPRSSYDESRCLKTSIYPTVNLVAKTRAIRDSTQPSYSLENKSRGTTSSTLSPLSRVEKSRRTRQQTLRLSSACGNSIGEVEVKRSQVFPHGQLREAKFLLPRASIPIEVKGKSLNGLHPSNLCLKRYNPCVSVVSETVSELLRHSQCGKQWTNSKLPDRMSSAVRFLLAYHICFRFVESPVFRRVPYYRFQRVAKVGKAGVTSSSDMLTRFPSEGELMECLTNSSRSDIIDGLSTRISRHRYNGHLIICFAEPENPMYSNRGVCPSDPRHDMPVASYFCFTPYTESEAAQVSYMGSRSCGFDPSSTCLSSIIDEAENQVSVQFRHILLSRPIGSRLLLSSPQTRGSYDWTLDLCREVDALCREMLSKTPFLTRVHRRNRIIASFFLGQSNGSTGSRLFGGSDSEKDIYHRYISSVSGFSSEFFWYSSHAVQIAICTGNLLRTAQAGQSYKHRVREMHKFMTSLSEENCGNIILCREVVRLLLSPSYLKDLKDFVTFLKPLTNLISLYCSDDAMQHWSTLSAMPRIVQSRSIGYVLYDCTRAFSDMQTHDEQRSKEFRTLKEHVFTRLFREGPNGLPPIVSDICYLAAILNPTVDVDTSFLSRDEILSRAIQVARDKYYHAELALGRELPEFLKSKLHLLETSSKSNPSMGINYEDPLVWWTKYGGNTPDLHHVALQVLSLPATTLAVIRFITNTNAQCDDLRGHSRDSLREKRRFTSWNLKLGDLSFQSESKAYLQRQEAIF